MAKAPNEAAAILAGEGVISEAEAREVFAAATAEGLELSEAKFEELLTANTANTANTAKGL